MINLIIKGNIFDAFNAAHSRGIALITAAQLFNDKPNEVVAGCADTAIDAVRVWFMASDGPAPYPAGALLFYSTKPDAAPDARLAWFEPDAVSAAIEYLDLAHGDSNPAVNDVIARLSRHDPLIAECENAEDGARLAAILASRD
jgi:hypothetical protein